ncbi:peptide chain release factor N(5)-glutamine methyltransferase [Marinomonas sp.]
MQIDALLKSASQRLEPLYESALLDAQLLLAQVLDVSTSYFYTWPDKVVDKAQLVAFEALLARRLAGEPIAYILERQAFWTLDLEVSPCTLIPRADTERLVEVALTKVPTQAASRILDLGTGTGAIALALASECQHAQVFGVDLIDEAVALAKRNAQRHDLSVRFTQSSWFEQLMNEKPFDLIVSNPPYIDPADQHLEQGDVRFEPKTALIAEEHGLADIRHIVIQAKTYLAQGACLIFEHGYDQAAQVREILAAEGYEQIESFQDYGGNDRVTLGHYSQS